MELYLLEWDNCLDYEDHNENLLGIYTTKKHRDKAKERYTNWAKENKNPYPLYDMSIGRFVESELESNTDWFIKYYNTRTISKANA